MCVQPRRKKYKQITNDEREIISWLYKERKSLEYIGRVIGKHKSSVIQEIKRNSSPGGYSIYNALSAQRRRDERRNNSNRRKTITTEMQEHIDEKLKDKQWSPEQIVGRCKQERKKMVSYETIYQYIYEDKRNGGDLYENLRRGHRKRRRRNTYNNRGIIKDRVMIDYCREVVNKQKRYCD